MDEVHMLAWTIKVVLSLIKVVRSRFYAVFSALVYHCCGPNKKDTEIYVSFFVSS